MIYSLFMISTIIFAGITYKSRSKNGLVNSTSGTRNFCILMGLLLFMIAAMRSKAVGLDVGQYTRLFIQCSDMSLRNVLENFDEPALYLLMKLLSYITDNPQWLLAIVGAVYAASISDFIFQNSDDPAASFIMLIPFQFYAFSLSGLRQAVALSIILFGFRYVKKRNPLKFLLCVTTAFFFHRSALLAIPIYALYGIQMTPIKRWIFILSIPIIYLFRITIINLGINLLYKEYSVYSSTAGSSTTLILYFAIWLLYLILIGSKQKGEKYEIEAIYLVGVVVQILVPYQPNLFRIAMYYQLFGILLLPKILQSPRLSSRTRTLANIGFVMMMFVMYFGFTYYAAGVNPYSFFWDK